MTSLSQIESQLESNPNWVMVSNKKNVIRGLEKLLSEGEGIVDLLDGLYRGRKISPDRDIPGVLFATNRRLLFITNELARPQYEEIPYGELRGISFERAFSSIIMTLKLRTSNVTFKTFDNRAAVSKFIESAGSGGVAPPAREESTLRILDEINETMKTLSAMNEAIAAQSREVSGRTEAVQPSLNRSIIESLFREAKKINDTIALVIREADREELREKLKEAITKDIIILSSLCRVGDKRMSDEELIFIALILLPLDPDGSGEAEKLAGRIFAEEAFPEKYTASLLSLWDRIAGYIKKAGSGIDLDGYSLRTMNLLQSIDRDKGTGLADRAGSALYSFAQFLMKADGSLESSEEERLRQIHRLIYRETTSTAVTIKEAEEETLEQVMEKINALVGMEKIKEQIATLVNLIKVQKERESRNLPVTPLSLHSVFYGPPGTGKTTIARLLGRVYRCLGILKKGQLIETDRAGLVAGYVGQTAINVDSVVQKALDGVLFIDEAYALVPEDTGGRDFGHEAVNTILKRMEDYRDRLVVIVAGYTEEMERFILSNPGLKSRFSRYFYFDHYSPDELMKIFDGFCANVSFKVDEAARAKMLALLSSLHARRDRTFGNGRLVRNIFERVVERQANRLAGIAPLSDELLCQITEADIPDERELIGV